MTAGAFPAPCSPSFRETHELILRLGSGIPASNAPRRRGNKGLQAAKSGTA